MKMLTVQLSLVVVPRWIGVKLTLFTYTLCQELLHRHLAWSLGPVSSQGREQRLLQAKGMDPRNVASQKPQT